MTKKPGASEQALMTQIADLAAQIADLAQRVRKLERAEKDRAGNTIRKRRQREREAEGLIVIDEMVVPEAIVNGLVAENWLEKDVSDQPDKIKEALERLFAEAMVREIKIGPCHA